MHPFWGTIFEPQQFECPLMGWFGMEIDSGPAGLDKLYSVGHCFLPENLPYVV